MHLFNRISTKSINLLFFKILHRTSDRMPRQRRRGRKKRKRTIREIPEKRNFNPENVEETEKVILKLEELEAIRLVDLEGLKQETAASEMGVSRRTLWKDLKSARKKVAKALTQGKKIEIKGGSYTLK